MRNSLVLSGFKSFLDSFNFYDLIKILVALDIKRRYRRSYLGPFWTSVSLSINIIIVTSIFTTIGEGSIRENLPYTAIGILLWHFISTNALEACDTFIQAATIIRQASAPVFVYVYRVIARNLVLFAHNIIILVLVYIVSPWRIGEDAILSAIGFLILLINMFSLAVILSIFTARYRDIGQLVTNILPILFYVTPIIWKRGFSNVVTRIDSYVILNPVYCSIAVIREPLLGHSVDIRCWYIVAGMTILLFTCSMYCYGRFSKRVAFWL